MSEIEQYDGSDLILEMMDKVATRLMRGKSELAIARDLGIKRIEVMRYRDLWREKLQSDAESTDVARDHLNKMVEHYDRLIHESYKILDDLNAMAFDEKVAAQKNTTLKNISEYEKVRVDFLQKAGLLEGASMGDLMADMERKQQIVVDILKDKDSLCPICRPTVMAKLRAVTGKTEAVQVDDNDIVDGEVVDDV